MLTPSQIGTMWILFAILCDVASTLFSAKANGLEDKLSQGIAGLLYFASFIGAAIALKYIQAGMLYVLWAGLGAIATAMLSKLFLGQDIDTHGWIGIIIICVGVGYIAKFSSIDI